MHPETGMAATDRQAGERPAGEGAGGGGRNPMLGDSFELFPETGFPELDAPGAHAIGVRSHKGHRADLYALVHDGTAPPRADPIASLTAVDSPSIVHLVGAGAVEWPADGTRRLVHVLTRPGGPPVMRSLADRTEPLREDELGRRFLAPALAALTHLSVRGLTHGAIRPTNLFLRDRAGLVLGECYSAPPGYGQPALFETIERGLAQPAGRGPGTMLDDLYALGVTLVFLALGHDPTEGQDPDAILTAKIEKGSYPAIVGSARLPGGVGELVRGLLSDDPRQRWTLQQAELWLSGRRLSPKQPPMMKRGQRGLELAGKEYWSPRTLAQALAGLPHEAMALIESGELERWVKRSVGDETCVGHLASAQQGGAPGHKSQSVGDQVLCRVIMALDPPGPIRYRGKAVMPDGLGPALAEAFLRRENYQPLAEIIVHQLPHFWTNLQPVFKPEYVPMVQNIDALKAHLERTTIGFGIERVLYETNRALPCLSPAIETYRVLTPLDLLRALERIAPRADPKQDPVDRHMVAFLNTRHRQFEELMLAQLGRSVEPARRGLAMVQMLAEVQGRHNNPALPQLARWCAGLLAPAVGRFRNRPLRERLHKQLEGAARTGQLSELLRIVDDPEALKRDQREFEAARRSHRAAITEIESLRKQIADKSEIAETTGRNIAATLACVLGTVIVCGIVIRYLTT